MPIHDYDIEQLGELYRRRELSPVEVVESCLDRIRTLDGALNAVIHTCAEQALAAARELERRFGGGDRLGPLAGIPYGAKDVIDTAGIPTTAGSHIYADRVPSVDAIVVQRLSGAGAILVAKLNTMELNIGDEWNPFFGPVRNPWSLEHYAGGSSAGCAASVAARFLPVALGSDTGGSIRVPAANSGVVGLRPTTGLLSVAGIEPAAASMDQPGPLASSVRAAALVLAAMRGAPPPVEADARELRVGLLGGLFADGVDRRVRHAVRRVADVLAGLGLAVVELEIPELDDSPAVAWPILVAEAAAAHALRGVALDGYGPATRSTVMAGQRVSAIELLRAQRARTRMTLACERVFERVDALLTPATPSPAGRFVAGRAVVEIDGVEQPWIETAFRLTQPFSLTGMPSLVVPCGLVDGLPVGVQITGARGEESRILAIGAAFEGARGPLRPPDPKPQLQETA